MRCQLKTNLPVVCILSLLSALAGIAGAQEKQAGTQAIVPVDPKLDRPIDFERDVFPILDSKCVACHNVAITENGLNLEDHKGVMKGGKRGPSVIAKDPDKSLLYKLASRAAQPVMPPLPNKVEASAVTPQELGILKQWILEGAEAGMGSADKKVQWQPLPGGIAPIYSVALTADGQYAASGRGNQISIYHVPTGETLAELTDPALLSIQYNGKQMYAPGSSHRDFVHSLAFSPNGRMLASGGYREVKLWSRPDVAERLNLAASTGPVPAVAVSADDKWLATVAADHSIKLWNLADGQAGKVLTGHTAAVSSVQFFPDGTRLVSSSHDKSVRIWNVADGALLARLDAPSALNGVALNLDGTKLITAGADNMIRVWDLPAATRQLATPAAPVVALKVSPDKKWLALAEADGKITLIDLASGQPKALAGHTGPVTSLAFAANSTRLVSSSADKTVRIWDVAAAQPVDVLHVSATPATAVAVHPNGNQVASGSSEGQISLWKLDVPAARPLAGDNGAPATVAAVSPDGKQLATAGIADGKPVIFVRDIASGNVTKTLAGHEGAITALKFSLDNTKLASGSADKTARAWNLADGKELAKFAEHTNTVTGVAFNSNAQQMASGAADNSLKLWNVADAKELFNFAGHTGAITDVAFTPNNQSMISASADQTIRLWNPANGQQAASIAHGQPVTALALTLDGAKLAATGADNTVKLYQLDGKLLFTLAGHTAPPRQVAFSPDHLRLVSSGADNAAMVWDVATGGLLESIPAPNGLTFATFGLGANSLLLGTADKAITLQSIHFERSLPGHMKSITGLVYTPAGDALYTAGEDGTVRRFVTANGQQQYSQNHGASIHDLALSADGTLLATAGENNQVHVWVAANGGNGPKPVLEGFTAPVRSVAFSLDNLHIASGTADNLVLVHNAKTGALEQVFAEHAGPVEALAAAGETGKQFISSSGDKTIRSWPLSAGLQIAGHTGPVNSVALITPAGTQVLSGSEDGSVRVWDLNAGTQVRTMAQGGPVTAVAVRPDGLFFASAGANNIARLWNAANGQAAAEMKGDVRLQRVVVDRTTDETEAKALVTLTTNAIPVAEKLSTDRAEALKKALEAKTAAEKVATDMAAAAKVAADAKAVADKAAIDTEAAAKAAADEKVIADKAVVDADAAAKAAAEKAAAAKAAADKDANDKALAEAKVAADKAAAEATEAAKKAAEVKVATDKKVTDTAAAAKAAADKKVTTDKADADATAAAKKADDDKTRTTDAATQADKAAKEAVEGIAKAKAASEAATAAQKVAETALAEAKAASTEREKPIRALSFSRDGKELAIGGDGATVCTFDGTTGVPFEILDAQQGPVLALAFTSKRAVVSGGTTQSAKLFDLNPPWVLAGVLGPKKETPLETIDSQLVDRVLCLDFSTDGNLLATGGGEPSRSGEVMIWDVTTQALVQNVVDAHSDTVFGIEFSRDGKYLLTGAADKFVKIFEVAGGKHIKSFEGHTNHVLDVSWRADGKVIASAGADNVIKVWNVESGEQERTIAGYTKQVTSLQFIGRSHLFVSCAGDKTVRYHLGDNGSNVRTFAGATDFMFATAASDNEQIVIAGGQDGILRVWNGTNAQVLKTFEPPKPADSAAAETPAKP